MEGVLFNHRKIMRSISVLMILVFICMGFFGITPKDARIVNAATETGTITEGTTNLRVRDAAGGNVMTDSSGNTIYLNGGTKLTILDKTNSAWFKVSFTYNGENIIGYVASSYIVAAGEEQTGGTSGNTGDNSDSSFEAKLTAQKFPETYKSYLRELHKLHPNWEFVAVHTGIEWSTLVENERNKSGQVKNLIYCSSGAPHYNWRATVVGYNWATDKWSAYDGTTWFAASQGMVEYYMDPRTYLYQNYIFAFEALTYQEGVHNQQGVEAILKGTFMYNAVPKGESKKYSQIIMEAADKYNVSPYHLASRMKLEMGSTAKSQATGTNASYPGIYNYFNIGATDSASGNAVTNGCRWAAQSGSYGRPWNTIYKAIMGGSQYLAEAYINKKQDTLYTQKFNVTNKNSLFSHQYMSNLQAPATESNSNYKAYVANGIIDSSMVFKIPVYNNMPTNAVSKPADSGNPNNWLKSLSIAGYTLTPSFSISSTTEYSLIVPSTVASVNISAATVNSYAKISGTGKINLNQGTNKITINVTAQNGNVRAYTLTIVRGSASAGNTNTGNTGNTDTGNTNTGNTNTGNVTTGSLGDLNGDGKINALDIVFIQRLIVGLDSLTADKLAVADINKDGKVTALDIVKVQRHIVGLETIK